MVIKSDDCTTCWSAFMYLDGETYVLMWGVDSMVSSYSYASAGYEGNNYPSPWDASNITRFAIITDLAEGFRGVCYSWTYATPGVLVGSCDDYPPLGHWWNVIVYP